MYGVSQNDSRHIPLCLSASSYFPGLLPPTLPPPISGTSVYVLRHRYRGAQRAVAKSKFCGSKTLARIPLWLKVMNRMQCLTAVSICPSSFPGRFVLCLSQKQVRILMISCHLNGAKNYALWSSWNCFPLKTSPLPLSIGLSNLIAYAGIGLPVNREYYHML